VLQCRNAMPSSGRLYECGADFRVNELNATAPPSCNHARLNDRIFPRSKWSTLGPILILPSLWTTDDGLNPVKALNFLQGKSIQLISNSRPSLLA
jgi:hypothetical protein